MFSFYNTQLVKRVTVDDEGTIYVWLADDKEPTTIDKDNELYERHMINVMRSYDALVKNNPTEEEAKEIEAQKQKDAHAKMQDLKNQIAEADRTGNTQKSAALVAHYNELEKVYGPC